MRRVERDQDQGQNQKPGWESNPGPETETEPGEELLEESVQLFPPLVSQLRISNECQMEERS